MTKQQTIVRTTVFDDKAKQHKTVRLSIALDMPAIAAALGARAVRNASRRAALLHGMIEAKILPEEGDTIYPRRPKFRP